MSKGANSFRAAGKRYCNSLGDNIWQSTAVDDFRRLISFNPKLIRLSSMS
ncbi:hypothetical protein X975_25825, partial [Stegodyphus mimosarum]